MTLIDETQNKKFVEIEERLGQRFQHIVNDTTGGLHNLVTHQTQVSADKMCGAIEALKGSNSNDSVRIEQKISDLATYMNQESSKHIEASLAMFQNTLRVQLDTMHTAQLGVHRDTDANVTTKLHSFFNDMQMKMEKVGMFEGVVKDAMQQLSQEQTEKFGMLSACFRELMRNQGDGATNNGIEWTLRRMESSADEPSSNGTGRGRPGTANPSGRRRSSDTATRTTYT
jgi:hypothetical protein